MNVDVDLSLPPWIRSAADNVLHAAIESTYLRSADGRDRVFAAIAGLMHVAGEHAKFDSENETTEAMWRFTCRCIATMDDCIPKGDRRRARVVPVLVQEVGDAGYERLVKPDTDTRRGRAEVLYSHMVGAHFAGDVDESRAAFALSMIDKCVGMLILIAAEQAGNVLGGGRTEVVEL